MTNQTQRHIYIDGSAPNNGSSLRGGIGVAIYNNEGQLLEGHSIPLIHQLHEGCVTNSDCEVLAMVKALELSHDGDTIYSDSDYVVKGCNCWLAGWKAKGWRTASKKEVAQRSYWQRIDELLQFKKVTVLKVKAHAGIEGNEQADQLAKVAADCRITSEVR